MSFDVDYVVDNGGVDFSGTPRAASLGDWIPSRQTEAVSGESPIPERLSWMGMGCASAPSSSDV